MERELASREIFFSIPLRSSAVHDQLLHSLAPPGSGYALASRRLMDTATVLNILQRAFVTVAVAVLNNYFPDDETTYSLTQSIVDLIETDDIALASFADMITSSYPGLSATSTSKNAQNLQSATWLHPSPCPTVNERYPGCTARLEPFRFPTRPEEALQDKRLAHGVVECGHQLVE